MANKGVSQTLQIVSIQHELSMSIGLSIDLVPMLTTFMKRLRQRLSLNSAMIAYQFGDTLTSPAYSALSVPSTLVEENNNVLSDLITSYYQSNNNDVCHKNIKGLDYYLFLIPDHGVLVLERAHREIDLKILQAIRPLLNKLAISIHACSQHEELKLEVENRKRVEQKLILQSLQDPLTGIANRNQFNIKLADHLESSLASGVYGAVYIIDLDRFKVINDSLGHSFGDDLLKVITKRLQQQSDKFEVLARISGDEFAVISPQLDRDKYKAKTKAEAIAAKLNSAFSEALCFNGQCIKITLSIGIQLFPLDNNPQYNSAHQNSIVNNADLAMYAVKRTSRDSYQFYNESMHAKNERRVKLENALYSAIQDNEFEVYYQPIVNGSALINAAEALLRWNSKSLGPVSPAEFIPVAEESGRIVDIGNWVLEQVCRNISDIDAQNRPNTLNYISVNISPRQFGALNFEHDFISILNKYSVPYDKLRIEITEGVALENISSAVSRMNRLVNRGVVFMLDDFGSGYSSLSYIHQLPLKTVKIDRSFTANIANNPNNQVIVNAIIDICVHFNLECVVEGVEHENEKNYLMTKGVNKFQGYFFYRPNSAAVLMELLEQQHAGH
ncbi:GGDEF domain-containing protein [Alteromonas sp. 5E99-2]|uniref:putative bifunctional diguanylate cyclase/phosphodiesterase n=1 Tax=Alteromonas sp. 5E99-2 TaxID=2817683 RepID=UPI001A99CA3A|nr:bifunctional diguanylate cyclase/phosphodiesterase [Alteromonas sp. 5E99-2]MBO1257058.1 GGDEF domain-containing protein [Alteromonas sp. 5E99-2]